MVHKQPHNYAGKTVKIVAGEFAGKDYHVEDWWDRVAGKSWMICDGNMACIQYAMRSTKLPLDDEVVYGKIGAFGHLIHVSELETV